MADFKTQLNQINVARSNFEKQERMLLSLNMRQQRGENITAAALQAAKSQLATAKAQVQAQIGILHKDQTLDALVGNWEPDVPLLLLPVRLQTRIVFSPTLGLYEVLVRIYPDDIFACSHEDVLTDAEVAAGKAYWNSIRLAEQATVVDKKVQLDMKKEAWRQLCGQFSGGRSLYVAKATTPTNRATLGQLVAETDMQFNKDAWAETKSNTWSKAAKTPILPDRFQVLVYKSTDPNATPQVVQTGNLITDTLQLGLDPLNDSGNFKKQNGDIIAGDEIKWMTDFAEAERVGMGIRVPIPISFFLPTSLPIPPTQPQGLALHMKMVGIARIVVVGVLTSADKTKSADLLKTTFENHLYTTKGMAFLKKGTPTNNTDANDSAWSVYNDPLSMDYYDGFKAYADRDTVSDGARLAKAFGIPISTFQNTPNAGKSETEATKQMNTALYPATMGYYIEELLYWISERCDRNELRSFFQQYVIGGGQYSTLRVGNQPYGVLLAGAGVSPDDKPFYKELERVLTNLLANCWTPLGQSTPRVGLGTNPEQTLINILSLHAHSVDFSQQWFYPTDPLVKGKVTTYEADVSKNYALIIDFVRSLYPHLVWWEVDDFPKIYIHQLVNTSVHSVSLQAENIIKPEVFDEDDLLSVGNNFNYLSWLSKLTSIRDLETLPLGTRAEISSLLFLMVRQAFLNSFTQAFEKLIVLPIFKAAEDSRTREVLSKMAAAQYYVAKYPQTAFNTKNTDPATTLWEIFQTVIALDDTPNSVTAPFAAQFTGKPLSDLLLSQPFIDKILAHFGQMTDNPNVVDTLRPIKAFVDFRISLGYLSKLPAAQLERTMISHLDCVSYRIDAWFEGMIARKLDQQRSKKPDGIYIGAFGWVEELKMTETTAQTEGGFIHAPSPTHATAAAVLKSAFLNHKQASGKSAFALNLQSQRLQKAQQVLERMRNNERLETILGYQFERELQDASSTQANASAASLFNFRKNYPITSLQVSPNPVEKPVKVPSNQNLVNGLALAEEFLDNPVAWKKKVPPPPTDRFVEESIQKAVANLADTLDAVKDLLVAETAYRMAQGNFDAVGATLEALDKGKLPQDLGFLESSRQPLFQFSNRVALHFDTEGVDSDFPESPRASAEAGLNRWCGQLLGNLKNIGFAVRHRPSPEANESKPTFFTLHVLQIQPLDFVCLSANLSELEARVAFVYRKKLNLSDDVTVRISFTESSAKTIRPVADVLPTALTIQRLITAARPLTAHDYLPNGSDESPSVIEAAEMRTRIDLIINKMQTILTSIQNTALSQTLILPESITPLSKLTDVFAAFKKIKHDATADDWLPKVFPNATNLQSQLIQLSAFGVAESFPRNVETTTPKAIMELVRQAATVVETTTQMLLEVRVGLADLPSDTESPLSHAEALMRLCKQVLGGSMPILPRFHYKNAAQIAESNSRRAELLKGSPNDPTPPDMKVEEWLQSTARVRPKLAQWESLRFMTASTPNLSLDIVPVQVPTDALEQRQTGGSKKPIYTWVAVEFAEGVTIRREVLSVVVTGDASKKTDKLQTGLLLDEWTESIPTDEELSALTFHYNQPNTEAPQAMLLSVCPDTKWTWSAVVGSVVNTLVNAKLRTVDILKIKEEGAKQTASPALKAIAQMLPMLVAPVNVQQHTFSLDFGLMNKAERTRMTGQTDPETLGHYQIWLE